LEKDVHGQTLGRRPKPRPSLQL